MSFIIHHISGIQQYRYCGIGIRWFSQRSKSIKQNDKSKGKFKKESTKPVEEKNRPYTLPPGAFRPKQSLGQNFLSDQNYVKKIVKAFIPLDPGENGERVVEIGHGTGAITRVLLPLYTDMTAIEIDQRSIEFLKKKLPNLNSIHKDVLDMDWPQHAIDKQGRLNVIGMSSS